MRLYKTEGIVIKKTNFGEADRILTVLTPQYGKIKVLAKGVRKINSRRSGHLELFHKSTLGLYEGKTFDIVIEAVRVPGYSFLERELVSISYAFYVCEIVDLLVPELQEQTEVFYLIESCLAKLAEAKKPVACDSIVSQTTVDLLQMLGYLSAERQIPFGSLHSYIESITERKLKTPQFIQKIV